MKLQRLYCESYYLNWEWKNFTSDYSTNPILFLKNVYMYIYLLFIVCVWVFT